MSFEEEVEVKKLQKLVKSSLLEINKLKLDIVKIEEEKDILIDNSKVNELEILVTELNDEIDEYKQNIAYLNSQIQDKDSQLEDLSSKLEYFTNLRLDFKENLQNFKEHELAAIQTELTNQKELTLTKEEEIKELNQRIISLQDEILELSNNYNNNKKDLEDAENNIKTKNEELQKASKELILTQNEVRTLENDLNNSKNENIDFKSKLKEYNIEIENKDSQIKDLSEKIDNYKIEIAELNNNIVNNTTIDELKREINTRDIALTEKENTINNLKEHYVPKEDYNKIQEEIIKKDAKIKKLEKVNVLFDEDKNNDNTLDYDEILSLKEEIAQTKESIKKLESIEEIYSRLTAPPIKNLSLMQSQIFNLLPEKPMSTYEIQKYINEVAFKDLSFGNIGNILRSIESKGYLTSEEKDGEVYWIKD